MRFSVHPLFLALAGPLACVVAFAPAPQMLAQSQPRAAPTRIVGSVTSISGQSVTVKPDSGAPLTFTVGSGARILETQPGAKTLAGATPIPLSGIAIGDRVLAALQTSASGSTLTATTLIAMRLN